LTVEIVPLEVDRHLSDVIDLTEEYLAWIVGEVLERYAVDAEAAAGMTVREFAEQMFEDLSPYAPPNGGFYVLAAEGALAGMGAFAKLHETVGTIRRMYIGPDHRGKGYGKMLLDQLLGAAKELGCTAVVLETGRFMLAAQHIYRSAGFVEREPYPKVETPPQLRPYWICMEKRL
jgi:GNAT superfamily N-acetyltransferase